MSKQQRHFTEMGQRIQNRRKELHLKQNELAEKINISNNHMSSIENGREKPSLETLLKLCEVLQVTPDYLLLGNIHPNNIPSNIIEGLRLCPKEDIELVRDFIELLIKRNSHSWTDDNLL